MGEFTDISDVGHLSGDDVRLPRWWREEHEDVRVGSSAPEGREDHGAIWTETRAVGPAADNGVADIEDVGHWSKEGASGCGS